LALPANSQTQPVSIQTGAAGGVNAICVCMGMNIFSPFPFYTAMQLRYTIRPFANKRSSYPEMPVNQNKS